MSVWAVVSGPTDRDTDDHDLVERVRAGEDRAFELLFLRYQPRIAAYVRGMVQDHGRAEDITQEVFISALRRMRETDREIAFKPWVYEIAKNACIDAFRRGRNASEVSFDARDAIGADDHGRLAEPCATPDAAVEGKVAFDNLCGAFGGLSPVHHDILVLREFEGRSYSEIGERLGMSRPAVESTLFRARKRLTEEYEELVSGERCLRVQRIVDASGSRTAGLRDRRRLARHLSHCQPCRRYARLAGMDLGDAVRMRPVAAAVRIAAFMPLPAFVRRRWSDDDVAPLFAHHAGGPVTQWSASAAATVDPSVVSGWTKALATERRSPIARGTSGRRARRSPRPPPEPSARSRRPSWPRRADRRSRIANARDRRVTSSGRGRRSPVAAQRPRGLRRRRRRPSPRRPPTRRPRLPPKAPRAAMSRLRPTRPAARSAGCSRPSAESHAIGMPRASAWASAPPPAPRPRTRCSTPSPSAWPRPSPS
jgi:RNA polymerase sigma factor (sigma-70 family)